LRRPSSPPFSFFRHKRRKKRAEEVFSFRDVFFSGGKGGEKGKKRRREFFPDWMAAAKLRLSFPFFPRSRRPRGRGGSLFPWLSFLSSPRADRSSPGSGIFRFFLVLASSEIFSPSFRELAMRLEFGGPPFSLSSPPLFPFPLSVR